MRNKTFTIAILGVVATVVLAITSVAELLRYSPYEDPGAGTAGAWLGLAALGVAGITLAAIGWPLAAGGIRWYLRWRRSLTPGARIAAGIAEIAAMEAAHGAWRHHNREVSGRLARSVMGEGPGEPGMIDMSTGDE